jgi:uncharacterized protein YpuA (DUF1002 family)
MGDYTKKNETHSEIKTERTIVEKTIDINELANAVAKAITINLPIHQKGIIVNENRQFDNFNISDEKTMENLAKSMIVQRSDNKSNFKDLGNVCETKKDIDDINNTIDLLSDID